MFSTTPILSYLPPRQLLLCQNASSLPSRPKPTAKATKHDKPLGPLPVSPMNQTPLLVLPGLPHKHSTFKKTQDASTFDVIAAYKTFVSDPDISMPVAAMQSLSELIAQTEIATMFELMEAVKDAATRLKRHYSHNSVSLSAGCEVFYQFISSLRDFGQDFEGFKSHIIAAVREYAQNTKQVKDTIAGNVDAFIKDDSVILTHGYSRVVVNALLISHRKGRRISVYVTETRPRGLGIKTHEILTKAEIPCTIILDSAVAYTMDKVDMVMVGCEAVVESGGIVNAIGSCQISMIARVFNKPVHVLAESYKWTRLFPLSQYDLPTHNDHILSFDLVSTPPTSGTNSPLPGTPRRHHPVLRTSDSIPSLLFSNAPPKLPPSSSSANSMSNVMPVGQAGRNPEVDYTPPEYITLLFTDAGILTPEGISSYLVTMSLRSESA
ncbi:translation initiation factor eIF-2B subunit alpha [Serendipita sp. 401]|nr:translation initiation factor eIF-2B subunit alpha [Serendipita sp. 401]